MQGVQNAWQCTASTAIIGVVAVLNKPDHDDLLFQPYAYKQSYRNAASRGMIEQRWLLKMVVWGSIHGLVI